MVERFLCVHVGKCNQEIARKDFFFSSRVGVFVMTESNFQLFDMLLSGGQNVGKDYIRIKDAADAPDNESQRERATKATVDKYIKLDENN